MRCPSCDSTKTRVVDSRLTEPGDSIRRRRECEQCGSRFTTYERAEAPAVTVIKRDGSRQQFDRQKLLRGLSRAANKRPITDVQLEALADAIAAEVRSTGTGEVQAQYVGELALRGLADLDPVTGILFASVYRQFADLDELQDEIRRIKSEPVAGPGQLAIDGAAPAVPSDPQRSMGHSPSRQSRGGKTQARETRRTHAARP
jgi:transcriptional repressor NrdR